ncbi:methylitaconate delta2-delta3-isomerase [Thermanaeromonas toyohensis ToBE]|uniref:Methylitaconate delta2-delta3-isomerase n=1 Tax=Thermanaeromonas toyohensis ToBE TaxID=698762 RepID=A0A1W1VJ53_9FIRM|nr:PrpF domain-containing protein [Thermanaeromonas toyohensis]SMB93409.1 methylitaconate delta2-delta3-isomerase [Thermanaeromonas toyohensis ToBE]
MGEMKRLRCAIIRGGTSKGVFFHENELPQDPVLRDKTILAVFGSPDVRQIDGLGGADPLTSKVAIIGPSSRPDADVDYTFGQVSIKEAFIDYSGNCGNISAGVGPFAIDEGLVKAVEPVTIVRIHNTNTGKLIIAEVPVRNGKAAVTGDYQIDGVPGTGAKIMLDFSDTAGAVTGKILPTGNPTDVLDIPGVGKITVSMVDVANPMVFVRAADLGLMGTETPEEVNNNPQLLRTLESIRAYAACVMGLAKEPEEATLRSPAFPMLAFVASPASYRKFTTGEEVRAEEIDFLSRLMFMQVMHKTYAGTGTTCTGVAAAIPGTVVYEVAARHSGNIRIGHPAGIIDIEVGVELKNGEIKVTRAAVGRTARRIMDGYVYIVKDKLL